MRSSLGCGADLRLVPMTLASGIHTDELDPAVRPQDDLFRHVNGKWIDRTEIPSDKARYGSFYVLAEEAEKAVRDIIVESQGAEPGTEARKVGDLYASFMDEARVEALGADADQGSSSRRPRRSTRSTSLLTTLGQLERGGVSGFFQLFVDNDPGQPRALPRLRRAGRPRPARRVVLPRGEVRRRSARRTSRSSSGCSRSPGSTTPPRAPPASSRSRPRSRATTGTTCARRDSEKTYNPMLWQAAERPRAGAVDLDVWLDALGVPEGSFDEVVVRQPSFIAGLGGCSRADSLEAWRDWLRLAGHPRRTPPTSRTDFVEANFDFYGRTLTGTPELRARWKRGVSLVEGALGEAVGRIYVERHFPPAAKAAMDVLVANLVEAYRQSHHRPRVDERRDPQARAREAREVHPQDRLPGEVARLLDARRSTPTT